MSTSRISGENHTWNLIIETESSQKYRVYPKEEIGCFSVDIHYPIKKEENLKLSICFIGQETDYHEAMLTAILEDIGKTPRGRTYKSIDYTDFTGRPVTKSFQNPHFNDIFFIYSPKNNQKK